MKTEGLRTLLFDIENSPRIVFSWDMFFKNGGSVIEEIEPSRMLSYSAQWLGEEKITVRSLRMYPTYKDDHKDDYLLVKDLHDLFDKADVIVAHNAKGHDIPYSNWRFMVHKRKPPSPYKVVDTLVVRKNLTKNKSASNSLNGISKEQGYGEKVDHEGFPLWKKCMHMLGGPKDWREAWKLMEEYNKNDVVLLLKTYLDLRGWMPNHPKDYSKTKDGSSPICKMPHCNGKTVWRGFHTKKGGRKTRAFQCKSCGSYDNVPVPKD
jgi:hypothetical protein